MEYAQYVSHMRDRTGAETLLGLALAAFPPTGAVALHRDGEEEKAIFYNDQGVWLLTESPGDRPAAVHKLQLFPFESVTDCTLTMPDLPAAMENGKMGAVLAATRLDLTFETGSLTVDGAAIEVTTHRDEQDNQAVTTLLGICVRCARSGVAVTVTAGED